MDIDMEDAVKDEEQRPIRIRPGYTEHISGNATYLRPDVFGPGPELPLATTKKPDLSQAIEQPGGPGVSTRLYTNPMGEALVEQRADPGLTQRELHLLHAEIKALQAVYGITYKDAAHRLFMAETERVKKASSAAHSFSELQKRIGNVIHEDILPAINAIDEGKFDDYILSDGAWKKRKTA